MGHLQVVTGLSDQLHRNAWSVLGEFWGRGAGRDLIITVGTMAPGFSRWTTSSSLKCPFLKVGTTLMLGIKYKYKHNYDIGYT